MQKLQLNEGTMYSFIAGIIIFEVPATYFVVYQSVTWYENLSHLIYNIQKIKNVFL
jgi:hypothetical protein